MPRDYVMGNNTYEYHRAYYLKNKERMDAYRKQWEIDNPKRTAYYTQKINAKKRGISFELTFEEWVDWWGEDWDRRGRCKTELVMARNGDTGAYSLDNIYKSTASDNVVESNRPRR